MRYGLCLRTILIAPVVVMLGCGGSSGGPGTGRLSVAITDASFDEVDEVWVRIIGVTVKPKNGSAIDFVFAAPLDIDLKTLTAENTETLLNGETVPAGEYNWIRLNVSAEFDGEMDSYVVPETGGMVELQVPSGQNTGLKLVSGFTVLAGGETSFVIDWNLRMGLVHPPGQPGYLLRPALRIVDEAVYGAIEGTVDTALVTDASCTSDPNTGEGNVVYVYPGNVTPDDIDDQVPEPLTTAEVRLNLDTGQHEYRAGFLPVGDYTVAFTCQAADDAVPDPTDLLLNVDDDIVFTPGVPASVSAGFTTVVPFGP